MKYFQKFERSQVGYYERLGEHPDKYMAALGHLYGGFMLLENNLLRTVHKFQRIDGQTPVTMSSDFSYRQKLDLVQQFCQKYQETIPWLPFPNQNIAQEALKEFLQSLGDCYLRINNLKNTICIIPFNTETPYDTISLDTQDKIHTAGTFMDETYLLDLYEYFFLRATEVEEIFIESLDDYLEQK